MLTTIVLWPGLVQGPVRAADPATERPNVLLILADDLGWADLGCYGNTFHRTPHIDRLAAEGLRFTQFYAGPVCSPTRANLQSGRDQARYGITQHIPGHRRPYARLIDPVVPSHLPLEVETFAERLQTAGYRTGYFGKWHLGGAGYGPGDQGWQTVIETKGHETPSAVTGSAPQRTAEFLTERAIAFMTAHRDQPFVVQVSHHLVHIPLSATPDRLAHYQSAAAQPGYPSLPAYAALVEELDDSVGRLVAAVDQLGLSARTLILFLSDNGGLEHQQGGSVVTSNLPLRGEKGTLYEGGIRVPGIARWTNHVPAGRECSVPATTHDIHATLLDLAGLGAAAAQPTDGVSLSGLLCDPDQPLSRQALYWHLPHYHHSTPASAIRHGDWKLIEFFETGERELFDLRRDPGETQNLAAAEPQRADELQRLLAAWREEVDARLPTPNPQFDAARADELGGSGRGGRQRE